VRGDRGGNAGGAREAGRLFAPPQHDAAGDEHADVQQGPVQRAQGLRYDLDPVHDAVVRERAPVGAGALNYAGAGTGTNPHIAGELFNLLGKVNIQAVQFKGGGPALIAAISGEVDVAFSGVAGAVQFVQSGRLRALGVTSLKPVAALPGVPTIAESGPPGYEFVAWFLLAAPKGTPREIIVTLNEHFRKAMTFADTINRFETEGLDVVGSSPEQAAATMESELRKYAVLIRERGMKAD